MKKQTIKLHTPLLKYMKNVPNQAIKSGTIFDNLIEHSKVILCHSVEAIWDVLKTIYDELLKLTP